MTNSGDYNTFEDMTLQGLDVGIEIGDVFSPDLTGTVIQRIDSIAVPVVFRLFGGNVAEVHFRDIGSSLGKTSLKLCLRKIFSFFRTERLQQGRVAGQKILTETQFAPT